jgi:putative FmdB family regulatory protein
VPIYEYECEKCGERLEKIQKVSDPPLERCYSCGGRLRRLIGVPAIQFKGKGWYITDYARKGMSTGGRSNGKSTGSKTDKGKSD